MPHRIAHQGRLIALAAGGLLVLPATASADCVRDLYREALNGHVVSYYSQACYSSAIAKETADIKTYNPQVDPALHAGQSRDKHRKLVVTLVPPKKVGRSATFTVKVSPTVRNLHLVLQVPGRKRIVLKSTLVSGTSLKLHVRFPKTGRMPVQLAHGWQLGSKIAYSFGRAISVVVH